MARPQPRYHLHNKTQQKGWGSRGLAEAGSAGRAVEQQLVVQGGARRVRVSASESIHEGAHRRGLRDLSPGSRGRVAGQELGLGCEPWLSPNSQG